MKKFAKIYILLLCWSIGTIAAAPVKGETDSVLAAVNGEPVTLGEILPSLQDREFRLRSAYSGKALEQEILKLRFRAVEELIDQKLIVADFNSKKLYIPRQELENELDRWGNYIGCHSRKELEERVRKSGSTLSELRKRLEKRMIVQIMRRREYLLAGPPSPGDLLRRFKEEKKKLSFPGSVELALLRLTADDQKNIERIKNALSENPAQWDQFAALYSLTPGTNGSIGVVELDKLRSEFAQAMKKIAEKKIYPAVKTADGVYFIKVLKYTPPRRPVFKEHAPQIKKIMENEIYRKCSAEYAQRLRDGAVIEYFFPVPEGVKKK